MKKAFKRIITILFRDKDGTIVIWQAPNLLLWAWFVFTLLSYALPLEHLKVGSGRIGGASLFAWSYLEITQGATLFRRLLGGVILISVLVGYFR